MSDDLVKRMREVGGMSDDGATRWYINPDGPEAASRIEKLEDELHHCFHRINELQAALREITTKDLFGMDWAIRTARKALEGKDD